MWVFYVMSLPLTLGMVVLTRRYFSGPDVPRYVSPLSFSFLLTFGRMGNIDEAVPFFGEGFNKIYPLIMVIYTLLVAGNFFDRMISFFGNWKILNFQSEADDLDGFDSSGLLILQRERTWIEQGQKVGELVIPLARNFGVLSIWIWRLTATHQIKVLPK